MWPVELLETGPVSSRLDCLLQAAARLGEKLGSLNREIPCCWGLCQGEEDKRPWVERLAGCLLEAAGLAGKLRAFVGAIPHCTPVGPDQL